MCGGGGPSADDIYNGYTDEEGNQVAGIKPTFGPLPSLSMNSKRDRGSRNSYANVRTGSKRRSLLAPMMQMASDA